MRLETAKETRHNRGIYHGDLVADAKIKKEEKMEKKVQEVVVNNANPIVMPVVSPEEAVEAWKKYEALKSKIVTDKDVQKIQGKDYLKKSYWRKIATFFNLSCECMEEHRAADNDFFTYVVTYKATAPNGRFSYGDGACSSTEKGLTKTEHNTRSIAHTRAYNRAVSNLVGGGEVSAEEMPIEESKNNKPQGDLTPTLHIGKYKGQSFEQIWQKDKQYLNWLYENTKEGELKQQLASFLDNKRFDTGLPENEFNG